MNEFTYARTLSLDQSRRELAEVRASERLREEIQQQEKDDDDRATE